MEKNVDFHSLPRRELQALCKKHKIPANMTNVAMADALGALFTAEASDETHVTQEPETSMKVNPPPQNNTTRRATRSSKKAAAVKEEGTEMKEIDGIPLIELPDTPAPPTGRKTRSRGTAKTPTNGKEEVEHEREEEKEALVAEEALTSQRRAAAKSRSRKVVSFAVSKGEGEGGLRFTKEVRQQTPMAKHPHPEDDKEKSTGVGTRRSTRLSSQKSTMEEAAASVTASGERRGRRSKAVTKMVDLSAMEERNDEKETPVAEEEEHTAAEVEPSDSIVTHKIDGGDDPKAQSSGMFASLETAENGRHQEDALETVEGPEMDAPNERTSADGDLTVGDTNTGVNADKEETSGGPVALVELQPVGGDITVEDSGNPSNSDAILVNKADEEEEGDDNSEEATTPTGGGNATTVAGVYPTDGDVNMEEESREEDIAASELQVTSNPGSNDAAIHKLNSEAVTPAAGDSECPGLLLSASEGANPGDSLMESPKYAKSDAVPVTGKHMEVDGIPEEIVPEIPKANSLGGENLNDDRVEEVDVGAGRDDKQQPCNDDVEPVVAAAMLVEAISPPEMLSDVKEEPKALVIEESAMEDSLGKENPNDDRVEEVDVGAGRDDKQQPSNDDVEPVVAAAMLVEAISPPETLSDVKEEPKALVFEESAMEDSIPVVMDGVVVDSVKEEDGEEKTASVDKELDMSSSRTNGSNRPKNNERGEGSISPWEMEDFNLLGALFSSPKGAEDYHYYFTQVMKEEEEEPSDDTAVQDNEEQISQEASKENEGAFFPSSCKGVESSCCGGDDLGNKQTDEKPSGVKLDASVQVEQLGLKERVGGEELTCPKLHDSGPGKTSDLATEEGSVKEKAVDGLKTEEVQMEMAIKSRNAPTELEDVRAQTETPISNAAFKIRIPMSKNHDSEAPSSMKISAAKKKNVSDDKENIVMFNNVMKVTVETPVLEKVTAKKTNQEKLTVEEMQGMSLRKLRKQLQALTLTDETRSAKKDDKRRYALATLHENCLKSPQPNH